MYSALAVDNVIVDCFFKLQAAAALASVKTYLDIDFLSVLDAQSASQ
jgi:hypothetical protein